MHIEISGHHIGHGHPCFVIAEAGVNHNGNIGLAHELVERAVSAGADAVKFQTFKAERLASPLAEKAIYQKENDGCSDNQLDMLRRLELAPDDYVSLQKHCTERGIMFLSTPFEEESADFLDAIGIEAFKLPSGEVTNLPFLRHVAAKGKPVIMSTGMATLGEVEGAVTAINGVPLALLHCTSAYPADPAQSNLRAMATLAAAFGVPVGFSDHTPGIIVSIAAATLGAAIIEKHFTLDRNLPGPDHRASLQPEELAEMIAGIRVAASALGNGLKRPQPAEQNTAAVARKSIVAVRDLPAGATLSPDVVAIMRPGTGLPPGMMSLVMGRKLACAVKAGMPLQWDMIQ